MFVGIIYIICAAHGSYTTVSYVESGLEVVGRLQIKLSVILSWALQSFFAYNTITWLLSAASLSTLQFCLPWSILSILSILSLTACAVDVLR